MTVGKAAVTEVDQKSMDALIDRIEHAIEHELALSLEDMKLIITTIATLCTLQHEMQQKNVTLHKLRKLLGMIKQSERRRSSVTNPDEVDSENDEAGSVETPSSTRKKRVTTNTTPKKKNKTIIPVVHHKLPTHQKGQSCAVCQRGKLYKHPPHQLLRVTGHSPYEAKLHVTECLRCNTCQVIVTAPLPEAVLSDGDSNQKYGYTARSLMVIQKFYSGLPYYHQSNLSDIFGQSVSASTIFDQCEAVANDVLPLFYELQRQAANAVMYQVDDTRNRILSQKPEYRSKRNGRGVQLRSGIYTSGMIATLDSGKEVILFETSLGHSGEHLDSILKKRDPDSPVPQVMADASRSNLPTVMSIQLSNCNAHARRQFVDLETQHPKEVEWVLETYGSIWENESSIREEELSSEERLEYHKTHSLPKMETLKEWATQKQVAEDFEESSAFGKAINYFLKHYEQLIMFCLMIDALIDNNRMEEKLKIAIRSRKQSHFFQTVVGAQVANVLTSIIATTDQARVNVYDYLLVLQQNKENVRAEPKLWLPWNFEKQLNIKTEQSKPDKVA